jgi:hypothetical protein
VREAGVKVDVRDTDSGPAVFVWAPLAKDAATQVACEQSFKDAILGSIGAIRIVASQRRKTRRRAH